MPKEDTPAAKAEEPKPATQENFLLKMITAIAALPTFAEMLKFPLPAICKAHVLGSIECPCKACEAEREGGTAKGTDHWWCRPLDKRIAWADEEREEIELWAAYQRGDFDGSPRGTLNRSMVCPGPQGRISR